MVKAFDIQMIGIEKRFPKGLTPAYANMVLKKSTRVGTCCSNEMYNLGSIYNFFKLDLPKAAAHFKVA